MATGKQKKRLINSIDSDQSRPGKKAKLHSSNSLVSLNPHIGLKWDQLLRRVVPEKEQEWTTCLTEDERKFLIQFLPSDTDVEENVHLLLSGQNFHFGNPFLSWQVHCAMVPVTVFLFAFMSSSLCYGDIHPDAVLSKEKQIKVAEKEHRIDLYNYHSNMVETLKKWRKRWLSCGDTENLFSDNPAKKKQGITQVSVFKVGMPLKVSQSVDVSKFMSYIEISRTQLNHIKRLKQSGDGIQTKHVSRVVGGLDKFPVKPFGALMEGEQTRLREHWLEVVRKDLPAALGVMKDRKVLMEKSRKLLGLELGEKNVSIMRKVEHSPQSISQGRNDQSQSLQEDDENTKYMETSICHIEGSNVKDSDLAVNLTNVTSQGEQISDAQNEDLTHIKLCKDGLDVQHDEIPEVRYKDTTLQSYSPENQQMKSTNCIRRHIHTLDDQHMKVQDLDGVAGPSIHPHDQDQDVHSISNTIVNNSSHGVNGPAEKGHLQMNTVIVGQQEADNLPMIPSCSSSLFPKYSGNQILVDDILESNDHVQGVKDRRQIAGPPESYCHRPENRMYEVSDDLQVAQSYLSSGQHSSSNNGHLQIVKDIRGISYSLQHANSIEQSTAFHSSTKNSLTESAPFPEQEQQLIEQSQSGLFVQQLHNNLYSGVRFPNSENPPVAEQHSYPDFAPMDHRYNNWSIEGDKLHNNNLSGLELDVCLTHVLPSGSNTDGSLFSAISQYRRPSVHRQPIRSSPSQLLEPENQVLPPRNFVTRPQDTNPPFSGIYGHNQDVASSTSSHIASVGFLNNMNWTSFIQQNPEMPDLTGRQFRGPWTR
ncbi:hypothetical protein PR202_gb26186 [Eleusine coracana subsp. coracana]|uniref:Uncharacterized protein n=1 Tax=Eleusine coracana subsp. coracana TaxID=191504 RepID=A0AAV5FNE1_ELECO|nr:hypothetical protein PR202_gb26158 [Eleusine coracana subsp. coracana]GJN37254.1 hypothetical protein PR202_gb26186 [Eleusine coracana subsp. coracana]